MKSILKYIVVAFLFTSWLSCSPERDDDYTLNPNVHTTSFDITALPDDPNRFEVKDVTSGTFQRLWSMPGGIPNASNKALDTIFFSKAGTYKVTLYTSSADGSGTTSITKEVNVATDAPISCSTTLSLLTGECLEAGKCWTFSHEAGAVKVGPSYDDFSWYSSPVDGLQDAQYDDGFCFTFEDFVYENRNNGASVNPWDGYKAQAYDGGKSSFVLSEGTGNSGRDQILLDNAQFMGVWDADNVLDIVTLTETSLVVRARICGQNGVPTVDGAWFELTFIRQ